MLVERLSDAVNPAPAECHVERLCVGNRGHAGALLVDPQPQLGLASVVPAEPGLERRLAAEALDLLGIRNDRRHGRLKASSGATRLKRIKADLKVRLYGMRSALPRLRGLEPVARGP